MKLKLSKFTTITGKFLMRITLVVFLANLIGCSLIALPNSDRQTIEKADLYVNRANTIMHHAKNINNKNNYESEDTLVTGSLLSKVLDVIK